MNHVHRIIKKNLTIVDPLGNVDRVQMLILSLVDHLGYVDCIPKKMIS